MSTSLSDWLATPLGCYLLAREQAYFDQTVADIFGFHALQVGLPACPFLAQSRIVSRWTLDYDRPADVIADPHTLPFGENENGLSDPSVLTEIYGWSLLTLINRYGQLAHGCLALLVVVYVAGLYDRTSMRPLTA